MPFKNQQKKSVPKFTPNCEGQVDSEPHLSDMSQDVMVSDLQPDCSTPSEGAAPRTITMATHKASKSGLETKHKASYDVLERECKKRRKRLGRTQDSLESMESELQEVHAHWADCRHTTKILQEALQTPKENGSQNMHGNHRSLLQDSTFQDDEIAYQQATNEDNQYLQEEVNTYRCDLQDCMEGLRSSQTAEQKAKVDLAAARQELEL